MENYERRMNKVMKGIQPQREDPNKPYTLAEKKIISLLEKQNNLLEELIRDIDRIHREVETIKLKL